jgi:hypothetical protein
MMSDDLLKEKLMRLNVFKKVISSIPVAQFMEDIVVFLFRDRVGDFLAEQAARYQSRCEKCPLERICVV